MGILKVGDKIKIKSLEWYNSAQKDTYSGCIKLKGNDFVSDMIKYLGHEATITETFYHKGHSNYHLDIDSEGWAWTDEMFEDVLLSVDSEKHFEVYQFGGLYVRVDTNNKLVYPEFFSTYQEAEGYGNKSWRSSKD